MASFEEEDLFRPLLVMEKVVVKLMEPTLPENWRIGGLITEVCQIYESNAPAADRIRLYSEMSGRLLDIVAKRQGEGVPQPFIRPLVYAQKVLKNIIQLLEEEKKKKTEEAELE
jgi:hypothetical protein